MLVLSGCGSHSEVVEGTSATVVVEQSFSSYNPLTAFGSSVATNASVFAATNSSFAAYDETPKLTPDPSFGSYELVGEDPLTVKYTIRDGVRWSDGTPVDAADLLLSWAANSGTLNDLEFEAGDHIDPETGQFTDGFPRDVVYFDGFSGNGLQLVTTTPVIGDDGRSITLTYDEYFPDWELVFDVGLAAHVVAGRALKIKDPEAAKAAMISAVQDREHPKLAAISRWWNSGFNFTSMPKDADLLVSTGPYTVTDIVADDHVTLTANPEYRGERSPHFETITVRFISDPLQAVAALADGSADVISPQASADVVSALTEIEGINLDRRVDGAWERLDLQLSAGKNATFAEPRVREAFLKTVPRERILDELIRPIDRDASPRSSFVFPPGTTEYENSVKVNGSRAFAKTDAAGARRLLDEAAAADPSLAKPAVCVLFDPANPRRVAEFQLIAGSAAEVGFEVTNCSSPDWRNLLGTPGAYDAALYALSETNLSVSATEAAFASGSTLGNYAHYASPEIDALIAAVSAAGSQKERSAILTEIDTAVWGEFGGIPLYQFPAITAIRPTVRAVSHSPLQGTALWNPWQWKPVSRG